MRILFANDGVGDAGGVQTYLETVMEGLSARGHELSFLHCATDTSKTVSTKLTGIPYFAVEERGLDRTMVEVERWSPDVCFSHNMHRLDVEDKLLTTLPVVKFMHGYFGTCIGGQKSHFFPTSQPCHRRFGAACLALYLPRRCGQLDVRKMAEQYEWAKRQHALLSSYISIVVASDHMKREYVGNGVHEKKVVVDPLFCSPMLPSENPQPRDANCRHVVFLGRMTKLKGGELLIRAVNDASRRLGNVINLTMAGDGPQRSRWEQLAARLGVPATFPGWLTADQRERLLGEATILAVPSVWPEPFGLVGLEAAAFGVPAIAFDVGGVREWLRDGVNGIVVPGRLPSWHALSKGLVEALSDDERLLEMGREARKVAVALSLDKHLDRLEQILGAAATARHQPVASLSGL